MTDEPQAESARAVGWMERDLYAENDRLAAGWKAAEAKIKIATEALAGCREWMIERDPGSHMAMYIEDLLKDIARDAKARVESQTPGGGM